MWQLTKKSWKQSQQIWFFKIILNIIFLYLNYILSMLIAFKICFSICFNYVLIISHLIYFKYIIHKNKIHHHIHEKESASYPLPAPLSWERSKCNNLHHVKKVKTISKNMIFQKYFKYKISIFKLYSKYVKCVLNTFFNLF